MADAFWRRPEPGHRIARLPELSRSDTNEEDVTDKPFVPRLGEPHHAAYLVEDIESAVGRFVGRLGTGPFILVEDVPLENVRSGGEVARLDHSSAFGSWDGFPIELLETKRVEPAPVRARWSGPRPRLHHLGYALSEEAAATARAALEERGLPAYLTSRLGETENSFHDASAILGHDVEIQIDAPAFREFFAMVLGAADGCDGTEPLRRIEV